MSLASSSSAESLTARIAKAEAFAKFALHDRAALPQAESSKSSLSGEKIQLSPGSAIIVTGYIPFNAVRFAVDLTCKSSPNNVALHFNPRLERGYVVRNSKYRNQWNEEETCSSSGRSGFVFSRNSYFHLTIFCTANEYQIAVDGEHFCAFAHRIPFADVNGLQVHGDVEEVRTRVTSLNVYPDPGICRSNRDLVLTADKPLEDNLEIPLTVDLPEGLQVGTRIFIKGRLKLLPHSFYLNLQKGRTIYPHPEIGLHLNPRFLFGAAEPCVVMNCWRNGFWELEERHDNVLSWGPGREFLLTLSCDYEAYTIWLGNNMIGEFRHRITLRNIDTLRICGDLVLHKLLINQP